MSRRSKSKDMFGTLPSLSKQTLLDLESAKSFESQEDILATYFGFPDYKQILKQKCLVNFYHQIFIFARQTGDCSLTFSIIKRVLDKLTDREELRNVLLELKSLLLQEKFEYTVAKEIMTFVKKMCEHSEIIRYVLLREQREEIQDLTVDIKLASLPEPLANAKTETQIKEEMEIEAERIRNIDLFPSELGALGFNVDIFESLSPEEVKKVTYDTVLKMIEEYTQKLDNVVTV